MSTISQEQQTQLNIEKIQVEIAHIIAQTSKLNKETKWYELIMFAAIGGGLVAAGVTLAKFLS